MSAAERYWERILASATQQDIQRALRIARGVEDGAAEVIQGHCRHTDKIDAQVKRRAGQQDFLGVQRRQERAAEGAASSAQQRTQQQAEQQRRVDGLLQVFLVPRAEKAGRQGVDADADAH